MGHVAQITAPGLPGRARRPYQAGWLLDKFSRVGISRDEVQQALWSRPSRFPARQHSAEAWDLLCLLEVSQQIAPPDVGLRMGQLLPMNEYGAFYSRFHDCRTMGDARMTVRQICQETQNAYLYRETIDDDEWIVDFALPIPLSSGARVLIDDLIARSKFEIEHLLGQPIRFRRIELPFPEPAYSALYADMFDCRIAFDKGRTRIALESDYLRMPCAIGQKPPGAECPAASDADTCNSAAIDRCTVQRVRLAILEVMIFHPGSHPSLGRVAKAFGVSTSTVKRWLGEAGLNYRLLADLVRRDHVAEYLAFTDLTPKEIAYRLGFTNVHNFRRAFRRWMDMTPAQFRQITQVQ